jgi:hypothetical protein
MALHELPSFTTNNANAADVENGLSTAGSLCVCVCARALARVRARAMVSQNEIYGKSTKENFARILAKNNLKSVHLKPV